MVGNSLSSLRSGFLCFLEAGLWSCLVSLGLVCSVVVVVVYYYSAPSLFSPSWVVVACSANLLKKSFFSWRILMVSSRFYAVSGTATLRRSKYWMVSNPWFKVEPYVLGVSFFFCYFFLFFGPVPTKKAFSSSLLCLSTYNFSLLN